MLKDVTIGQYYPTGSVIHKLDPRVKLSATVLYIVSLFIGKNPVVYVLATIFLFVCIGISRVPIKYMMRGLRAVMFIMAITLVFNVFMTDGEVIWTFYKLQVTKEGIYQAIYMGLRLVLLIMGSSLMTLTTTPNDLTDGMEKGLGFLKVIKIPVHEIAMMMSIALRFIPILMDEADKIMKAQKARGADLESGNFFKRMKALVPIFVPLFVSAIRRAYDLATAMESRGYHGGKGRTKMKPLKYHASDRIAYLIVWIYMALMIAARILWDRFMV